MKHLIILCMLILFAVSLQAQTNGTSQSMLMSTGNILPEYNGDFESLAALLQLESEMEQGMMVREMKGIYKTMTDIDLTDQELDDMLDANQSNYDVWMDALEHVTTSGLYGAGQKYILESLLTNIAANM